MCGEDTTKESNAGLTSLFDGYYRRPERKIAQTTLKLYEDQFIKLKHDYKGNMSVIVRLLLERFFNGDIPEVEAKFKQMQEAAEEANRIIREAQG